MLPLQTGQDGTEPRASGAGRVSPCLHAPRPSRSGPCASAAVHAVTAGQPTAPKEARVHAILPFSSLSGSKWLEEVWGGIPLPQLVSHGFKSIGVSGGSA